MAPIWQIYALWMVCFASYRLSQRSQKPLAIDKGNGVWHKSSKSCPRHASVTSVNLIAQRPLVFRGGRHKMMHWHVIFYLALFYVMPLAGVGVVSKSVI